MTDENKIQNRWLKIQTFVMFLAFAGAVYIGVVQNSINQKLLDLNFLPSVKVDYDNGQINVFNTGDRDIFVGIIFINDPLTSSTPQNNIDWSQTRLITPGGYYFFLPDPVEQAAMTQHFKSMGANGEYYIPTVVRLKSIDGAKYVANCLLFLHSQNGITSTDMQTLSIVQQDWSDASSSPDE